MPLRTDDSSAVRARLFQLLMQTISSVELIKENADELYGDSANIIRVAIDEYLDDFIRNPNESGETHPEALIYGAPREALQRAGLYGAQLALKERQVQSANTELQGVIARHRGGGLRKWFRAPFSKWVDRINNVLGSLVSATGLGEAIKELKDCLRDELPDKD